MKQTPKFHVKKPQLGGHEPPIRYFFTCLFDMQNLLCIVNIQLHGHNEIRRGKRKETVLSKTTGLLLTFRVLHIADIRL